MEIFNFLASIALDLAGIIDTQIRNVILQGGLMKPCMPFSLENGTLNSNITANPYIQHPWLRHNLHTA